MLSKQIENKTPQVYEAIFFLLKDWALSEPEMPGKPEKEKGRQLTWAKKIKAFKVH